MKGGKLLKSKRAFIEGLQKDGNFQSGSFYEVSVGTGKDFTAVGDVSLTLADCNRKITWYFGTPGNKRAVKKIKVIKKLIDEIYEHLVPEEQR